MKIKKNKWFIVAVSVFILIFTTIQSANAGLLFITHPSVKIDSLTKSEIKDIFIGDKIFWPDGREIAFVVLRMMPAYQMFTVRYARKSPEQYLRYWKKQMFTGKGFMPKSFMEEKDVIKFVSETKGAIGYVPDTAVLNGVKVIKIIEN